LGLPFRKVSSDPATWLPFATHVVVNDIILGLAFLPVAMVESVATNAYSAVRHWIGGSSPGTSLDSASMGGSFGLDIGSSSIFLNSFCPGCNYGFTANPNYGGSLTDPSSSYNSGGIENPGVSLPLDLSSF
jgi:hypothetical protein